MCRVQKRLPHQLSVFQVNDFLEYSIHIEGCCVCPIYVQTWLNILMDSVWEPTIELRTCAVLGQFSFANKYSGYLLKLCGVNFDVHIAFVLLFFCQSAKVWDLILPFLKVVIKVIPLQAGFEYVPVASFIPLNDSTSDMIKLGQYAENLSSFALPTKPESRAIRLYVRR